MTDEKDKDRLIDPQWLIQARKRRRMFIGRLGMIFLLFTVMAWWVLPTFRERIQDIQKAVPATKGSKAKPAPELPAMVSVLVACVGMFKVFWGAIAIGCGAAALLTLTGKIDTLVPVLNWVLLAVGVAIVALCFYVFYLPSITLLDRLG